MEKKTIKYKKGDRTICSCMGAILYTDHMSWNGELYWCHYDIRSGLLRTRYCYPIIEAMPRSEYLEIGARGYGEESVEA